MRGPRRTRAFAVGVALALTTTAAHAQPKKPEPKDAKTPDKGDAKALLASGLKLFAAKDYISALAVFRDAYARFPSPKILLNIGTTLKALGRNAEAANTYQQYLDAPDSEANKKADVAKVVAELDAKVGTVLLKVTPTDAEVQFGTGELQPSLLVTNVRVEPGTTTINVKREGFQPKTQTVDLAAGKSATLTIDLVAIPVAPPVDTTPEPAVTDRVDGPDDNTASPSKLGVFAHALISVDPDKPGGAARVGASYTVIPRLHAELAAILGPKFGGYAGARYAILGGTFRSLVAVGLPVLFSDGPRIAVRGAAGLEVVLGKRISIVAELGVERVLNAEMSYAKTYFLPALGAVGRL